jgi:hypothetical protein
MGPYSANQDRRLHRQAAGTAYLPVRVESFSEVRLHAEPIDRFVEFVDSVGKGETDSKFQFYVDVAGQGEISTNLIDVSRYLFEWDERGSPPRLSLAARLQWLWVKAVLRLRSIRGERLAPSSEEELSWHLDHDC